MVIATRLHWALCRCKLAPISNLRISKQVLWIQEKKFGSHPVSDAIAIAIAKCRQGKVLHESGFFKSPNIARNISLSFSRMYYAARIGWYEFLTRQCACTHFRLRLNPSSYSSVRQAKAIFKDSRRDARPPPRWPTRARWSVPRSGVTAFLGTCSYDVHTEGGVVSPKADYVAWSLPTRGREF